MVDPSRATLTFNLERQRQLLEEQQKLIRAEFVEVELDLAITFCQIALSSGDTEKMERNEGHAEEAYESAMRFLSALPAPEPLQNQIEDKLAHLRSLLDELRRKP